MKTPFRLVCIAACAMLLTACATTIRSVDKTVRQSDIPSVGEVQTAELGASLLVQQNVVVMRGRMVEKVTHKQISTNAYSFADFFGLYVRVNEGQDYCGQIIGYPYLGQKPGPAQICLTEKEFSDLNIPFVEGEKIVQEPTNLQKNLEYSGKAGNIISLFYKEFNGTTDGVFIRPAFTQEFKFDLSESNIIGIKGARIEVVQANNTGITYKVFSHFPR